MLGSSETEYSYTLDDVEDSQLYDSLQRSKPTHLHGDSQCLNIKLTLATKKDKSKVQEYKIITGIDELQITDKLVIEFKAHKEASRINDVDLEISLISKLYPEVIEQLQLHYQGLLDDKLVEKNYMMLYGQKGTGKTFLTQYILPSLFPSANIEYLDLNYIMLLSNNFSDVESVIKYLTNIFLTFSDHKNILFIIDHLDCALPKEDSNEMMDATKRIKQNQLLLFFTELIDSKKYNLLFVGRHYQNIHIDLASISRIDKFTQMPPPDFNHRKKAFEVIISKVYKPKPRNEFGHIDYQRRDLMLEQLGKVCIGLAAKTEHYRFTNIIQVAKSFYKYKQ